MIMARAAKQDRRPFTLHPMIVTYTIIWLLLFGILLGYSTPVFAAGTQDEIGDVIATLVETITTIIRNIAVGIGALGLTTWAVGKIARPLFPQISQMTSNYIPDLLIGIAFVFVASSVVNGLASAMGSTA